MLHQTLFNAKFHELLNKIDQEIAANVQQQGCACGGQLHHADYPRTPFGILAIWRVHYDRRISFCCHHCRKRTTPPSVRFFGQRRFPAPWLLIVSILGLGINEQRLAQVKRHLGIQLSESTWKRWRRWWREQFPTTRFWQQTKGLLIPHLDETQSLSRAIWACFQATHIDNKLLQLLRFLSPLSCRILQVI